MAEPTYPEHPDTAPRPSRLPLPLVGRVLGIVIVLGAVASRRRGLASQRCPPAHG